MHKSSFLRAIFQRQLRSTSKNKNKIHIVVNKANVQRYSQIANDWWNPNYSIKSTRDFGSPSENKNQAHSTVDKNEVQMHSQLASKWWDPNGPQKPLHSMNLIRVPLVRDGLLQYSTYERNMAPLKNLNILDVGCGGGILSEALARLGANVTGIDASKVLIEVAEDHSSKNPALANNKPTYICTAAEDHVKNSSNYYDGVVASEIIEHVSNKELFVKSCTEALKPGGRIFFTTPNRTKMSQILTICVAEYVLNLVPKGTHDFSKFVTPNELTFLLERSNCHVESIYGLMYYFYKNKWDIVDSQALMFALQAVKIN